MTSNFLRATINKLKQSQPNHSYNPNPTNKKSLQHILRSVVLITPMLTLSEWYSKFMYWLVGDFIIVIVLIIATYCLHQFHLDIENVAGADGFEKISKRQKQRQQNSSPIHLRKLMQSCRKFIACLCSCILLSLLIIQVSQVVIVIYKVSYGQQIMYWFRFVLTFSNFSANMELCENTHRKNKSFIKAKTAPNNKQTIVQNYQFNNDDFHQTQCEQTQRFSQSY